MAAETSLEFRKKYIVYMRAILTLVILLLGIYNYSYIEKDVPYVGFFLVLVVLSNFIFMVLPSRMFEGIKLHYIIFLLDIIIIGLSAYWLTMINMQVFMVIFLTIFISALSQSSSAAILIAIAANAVYIFLKVQVTGEGIIISDNSALMNIPFIFVVALHSSYLAEKANEDTAEKNRLRAANAVLSENFKNAGTELTSFIEYTERVYDSFSEGLILMDTGGSIKVFNRHCERLFNIRRSKVLHMNIRELEVFKTLRPVVTNLSIKKQDEIKEKISYDSGGLRKEANVSVNYIKDREGNKIGILCRIEHVPIDFGKGHTL